MRATTLAVLALAEVKAAIARFESGAENAADSVTAIVEACEAAKASALTDQNMA